MKQIEVFCVMTPGIGGTVKDAIAAALVRLMQDKRLEQITVGEIAKQAWVGRSTFYRNFESKEDVLRFYIRTLFDADERDEDPYSNDHLRAFIVSRFRLCREHKDIFTALQKNGLLHLLYQQGAVIARDNIAEFDLYRNPYQAVFFSSVAIGVMVQWIEGGFREDEQAMADMFIYLMDGHHRSVPGPGQLQQPPSHEGVSIRHRSAKTHP